MRIRRLKVRFGIDVLSVRRNGEITVSCACGRCGELYNLKNII